MYSMKIRVRRSYLIFDDGKKVEKEFVNLGSHAVMIAQINL